MSEPGGREVTPVASDAVVLEPLDEARLRRDLAQAVLATPSVLRIEATMATAMRRLSAIPSPADSLQVSTRNGPVDVTVHLAVTSEKPARIVAHAVRDAVRSALVAAGQEPGALKVRILSLATATSVDEGRSA